MFSRQSGFNMSGSRGSNLVEFRAGRMNMIGKMVHPDNRKGLVYMTQSDDGLMHFCWKDRTTEKVEDDLIVFPDDFEFKRVNQCKTGRVYVLIFKMSSRRMFYWMQEPNTDRDEEYSNRVNELLNNSPTDTQYTQESTHVQRMLNNMSRQELIQLLRGVSQMIGVNYVLGSKIRPCKMARVIIRYRRPLGRVREIPVNNTAPSRIVSMNKTKNSNGLVTESSSDGNDTEINVTSTDNQIETGTKKSSDTFTSVNTSQSYLSNLSSEAGSGRSFNIDLSTASTSLSTSDSVNDLVSDPERVNMLSGHLPESENLDEDRMQQVKDTIALPQFQQALLLFYNALQTAQMGSVVSQIELTPDAFAAAYAGNLEDFVKALEEALPAGTTMPTSNINKDFNKDTDKTK